MFYNLVIGMTRRQVDATHFHLLLPHARSVQKTTNECIDQWVNVNGEGNENMSSRE